MDNLGKDNFYMKDIASMGKVDSNFSPHKDNNLSNQQQDVQNRIRIDKRNACQKSDRRETGSELGRCKCCGRCYGIS
jgi:hypothetical protein